MSDYLTTANALRATTINSNLNFTPDNARNVILNQSSIWQNNGIIIPQDSIQRFQSNPNFQDAFSTFEREIESIQQNQIRNFDMNLGTQVQSNTTQVPGFVFGAGSDPNVRRNDTIIDIPRGTYNNLNILTVDSNGNFSGVTAADENLSNARNFENFNINNANLGNNGWGINVNVRTLPNGNEGITDGTIRVGNNNIQIQQGSNSLLVNGRELAPGEEIIFDQTTLARIKRSEENPSMYSLFTPNGDDIQILKDEAFGHWNFYGRVNGRDINTEDINHSLSVSYDEATPETPGETPPEDNEETPPPPEIPVITLETNTVNLPSPVASTLTTAPINPETREGVQVNGNYGIYSGNNQQESGEQTSIADVPSSLRYERVNEDGTLGLGFSYNTQPARGSEVAQLNFNIGNRLFDDEGNPITNERFGLGIGAGINFNNPGTSQTSGTLVATFNDGRRFEHPLGVIGEGQYQSNDGYLRVGPFYTNNAFGLTTEDREEYPNLAIPDVNVNAGIGVNIPFNGANPTPQLDLELSSNNSNDFNWFLRGSVLPETGDYSAQTGFRIRF